VNVFAKIPRLALACLVTVSVAGCIIPPYKAPSGFSSSYKRHLQVINPYDIALWDVDRIERNRQREAARVAVKKAAREAAKASARAERVAEKADRVAKKADREAEAKPEGTDEPDADVQLSEKADSDAAG